MRLEQAQLLSFLYFNFCRRGYKRKMLNSFLQKFLGLILESSVWGFNWVHVLLLASPWRGHGYDLSASSYPWILTCAGYWVDDSDSVAANFYVYVWDNSFDLRRFCWELNLEWTQKRQHPKSKLFLMLRVSVYPLLAIMDPLIPF